MADNEDVPEVTIFEGVNLQALKDELAEKAFGGGPVEAGHCRRCRSQFTTKNVFTLAGWKETEISGICEKCWNELWAEDE